jgi:hypothetical protein
MWSSSLLRISAKVVGDEGELKLLNPLGPQVWHRLTVRAKGSKRIERFERRSTYENQLDASRGMRLLAAPEIFDPDDDG